MADKTTERRDRPDVLASETHRIETGYGKVYVTIGRDEDGDLFEVFVDTGDSGGYTNAWCEAIGKTISNALRAGVDPETIYDDLQLIRTDQREIDNGDLIYSVPDAIGVAMQRADEGKPATAVRGLPPAMAGDDDEEAEEDDDPFLFEVGEGDMP